MPSAKWEPEPGLNYWHPQLLTSTTTDFVIHPPLPLLRNRKQSSICYFLLVAGPSSFSACSHLFNVALPCRKQLASQPYFCLWLQPPFSWVGSAVLSRALKCLSIVCTVTSCRSYLLFFNFSEIPSAMAQCCSMERQWWGCFYNAYSCMWSGSAFWLNFSFTKGVFVSQRCNRYEREAGRAAN